MPAFDLIDRDWDAGIEQEVGVEWVDGGSTDAAGAAECLDQFGLVDLPADGFDVRVWVEVALGGDTGAGAHGPRCLRDRRSAIDSAEILVANGCSRQSSPAGPTPMRGKLFEKISSIPL